MADADFDAEFARQNGGGTDDDFEAEFKKQSIPAPHGDVTVPKQAPSTTKPRDYDFGETALIHGAHGAAGDIPGSIAAFYSAHAPSWMPGGIPEGVRPTYDEASDAAKARLAESAKQRPVTAGTSEFAGTVAPFLAGGSFIKGAQGAGLAGQAARAAAIGGVQGAAKDGAEGAAMGALFGAAGPGVAGLGSVAPNAAKWAARGLMAGNTVAQGRTLLDKDATPAQQVEARWNMLAPIAFHAAGAPERKASKLDPQIRQYDADLMAPEGPVETRVRENGRTLQEAQEQQAADFAKAEADARKNALEVRGAQEEFKKDYEQRQRDAIAGAESVNKELTAAQKKRTGEQKRAIGQAEKVNAEVDDVLAQRRIEAERESALKKIGREREYDRQVAEVDARNAKARDEFNAAMAEYQRADAAAKEHQKAQKALAGDAAAEAKRLAAVTAEHEKRVASFEKATKALSDELATLEAEQEGLGRSADASWAKKHADAQAHIAGFLRVAEMAQQEIPPELMARMKRLAGHLADVREDNAPVRFAEYEKLANTPKDDFRQQYIREHGAEGAARIDRLEGELKGRQAPSREDAEAAVAKKQDKSLSAEDKARLAAFVKSRGGVLNEAGEAILSDGPTLPEKPILKTEAKPSRAPLREADRQAAEAGLQKRVASDKNEIAKRHGSGLVEIPDDVNVSRFLKDRLSSVPEMPPEEMRPNPDALPSDQVPVWKRPNPQDLSVVENQEQTRRRMLDEAVAEIRRQMTRAGVPEKRSIGQQYERENTGVVNRVKNAVLPAKLRVASEIASPTERDVLSRYFAGKTPAEALAILQAARAERAPKPSALTSAIAKRLGIQPGTALGTLGDKPAGRAAILAAAAHALEQKRKKKAAP